MSATIIPFPGCGMPKQSIRSDPLAGLTGKQKALLVQQDEDGYFAIRLAPVLNARDAQVELRFADHAEARATARDIHQRFPGLYRFVIDEVAA